MILVEIRDQLGLDWGGIALELAAKSRGIGRLYAWCFPSKGGKIVSAVAEFCEKNRLFKKVLETGKVNDVT